MAIIALFISKAADYLVEKQEVLFFKALHMNMKGGEAKMLRAMQTRRIKYKFYIVALLLAIVIVAGTLFLWKVEKLSLVDSFLGKVRFSTLDYQNRPILVLELRNRTFYTSN